MTQPTDFWFPVKRHGYGWGLPVRWQGWVVMIVFVGAQIVGVRHFVARRDFADTLFCLVGLSALLIAIVALKGERPLRWRWDAKEKQDDH
jgi:hypothetical protein